MIEAAQVPAVPDPAVPDPEPSMDECLEGAEREHVLVLQSNEAMVLHAIRAGEWLEKAKDKVKYGQWGAWLAERVSFSARTARVYMQAYRERQNPAVLEARSLDGALKAISKPAPKVPDGPLTFPFPEIGGEPCAGPSAEWRARLKQAGSKPKAPPRTVVAELDRLRAREAPGSRLYMALGTVLEAVREEARR